LREDVGGTIFGLAGRGNHHVDDGADGVDHTVFDGRVVCISVVSNAAGY
jgi:hypothetical protein